MYVWQAANQALFWVQSSETPVSSPKPKLKTLRLWVWKIRGAHSCPHCGALQISKTQNFLLEAVPCKTSTN